MTAFHHMAAMVRFIVRQDRLRLFIWMMSLVAASVATASSFTSLYASDEERQAMALTVDNPAMTAMLGPGYGLDHYTEAAMMAHQMLMLTAVVVAVMNILLITRHTRAPEEDGRLEMLRSLPFGKLSPLGAAMIVMTGANLLLALLTAFGLYALGIDSLDLQGSLLYGAVLGGVGLFFATVTAVFAQLSESARGTLGFSFAALGLAYFLRAIGDVSSEALSWLSPLGWAVRTKTYVENEWGPLLLLIAAGVLLFAIALRLQLVRDLDAGFMPARAGKKEASAFLQGPLALAIRLQRTTMISWLVAMALLGASYGSVLGDLETFFSSNEMMADMFASAEGVSMTEQFISMIIMVLTMAAAIPALLVIFKLKAEERKQRNEHVLARAVARGRQLGSYAGLALAVSISMAVIAALALGLTGAAVMDEQIDVGRFVGAALAYVPALFVIVGLGAFFVGVFPQASVFAWLYLVFSFIANYFGELFQFPSWLMQLTPFGHVPQLPMDEFNYAPAGVLLLVATGLFALAFLGYRRRDIQG
ncbi:ABC transporter permease [Alkalihalobacillus oceani]|uniref:ABC transporter permease n=1 Tax=Halalkalibacter oceani TaxID=1653776 RepID=A0A9X2DSS1_9BACI|nr:ABC transporter permease [Halalkalibacter oceani]MCM3716364.1 ABC transporter permease [Halalkalibacter oceani]